MHWESEHGPELVRAARAGDGPARERLVADYLPLVYNIVGRALDGHADVDDVVQDTMFRALDGLGGLREPSRFRPWLVAIAMNQVRRRWRDRQQAPVASLDRAVERPHPAGDFVDLTILRLGLSGQRREVAEATRWLDEDDRELLALWWQEAAGELTRAELAEALGVPARHAAVRVQRLKERLETGRVVVRALGARPRCRELERLTDDWDGRPAGVWRKRVARHARGCRACGGHWSDLVPAEGLLAGLALVVPLTGYPSVPVGASALAAASEAAPAAGLAPPADAGFPAVPIPAGPHAVPAAQAGHSVETAAQAGPDAGSAAQAGPDAGSAAQAGPAVEAAAQVGPDEEGAGGGLPGEGAPRQRVRVPRPGPGLPHKVGLPRRVGPPRVPVRGGGRRTPGWEALSRGCCCWGCCGRARAPGTYRCPRRTPRSCRSRPRRPRRGCGSRRRCRPPGRRCGPRAPLRRRRPRPPRRGPPRPPWSSASRTWSTPAGRGPAAVRCGSIRG
ncbi:RNA polymerase sigma factor [Streptomyces sp. CC228A]|uniref:RNA polymerase sigma factor n=1 Tax=Streptomyces sp. CC228A TaxID=2898186 RepID=UPI001F273517|nr:sigma-70 family RNA polymerase sigma factor [Streptomyces sp. CC228A]